VATVVLATLWVQTTDNNFDNMRQRVDHNVPIAAASFKQAERYFQAKGSSPLHSQDQAHALMRQWTHSNARVFALQTVLRELAMVTAVALPLALLVRRRKSAPAVLPREEVRAAA
jgi:hypothetical protein